MFNGYAGSKRNKRRSLKMNRRSMFYVNLILIVALSLTNLSCGSSSGGGDKLADISGIWQGHDCNCEIVIDLASDTKTMTIAEQKLTVSVKEIVADKLALNVSDGNGTTEDWQLIQVWDDNGSTFSLALIRNGKREKLSLVKKLT
jgi:hypothetical protein